MGKDDLGYAIIVLNDVALGVAFPWPKYLFEIPEFDRGHINDLFSRTTLRASLSVLRPKKTGCLICPSLVHSVNFTSHTSRGRTQVVVRSPGTSASMGFRSDRRGTS